MLVQFPATALAHWATQTLPGLTIQQVSGSAIHGTAQDMRLQGMRIASLTWRMRFLPLLLGRIEYRVSVTETGLQLNAVVGTGFNKQWRLKDIAGALPLPRALSIARPTPIPVNGDLIIDAAEARWDNEGNIYAADGTVRIINMRTTLADPFQIGSFNAELSADTPNLLAALEDSGGPLGFSGTFSLAPDGRYQLMGRANLRDTADNRLRDTLNVLGQPSGDGQWQLDLSGQLGKG